MTLLMVGATFQRRDSISQIRRYTRSIEYDYFNWTLDALFIKLEQYSLGTAAYLPEADRHDLVLTYFDKVREARRIESRLHEILADPNLKDPEIIAAPIIVERDDVWKTLSELEPIVETVLQEQVATVLSELGVHLLGTPFPPVAFHFTKPPMALIISPREVIRQDANISLTADLALEDQIKLESDVEASLNLSSLVVPVGGIGVYPTMIQESSSLAWLTETIVHEWVHNYLTLRPLGMNYFASPELRTMNETAANLLGKEISRMVLEQYYPAFVPPPPVETPSTHPPTTEPPPFDFRAEMRETRVTVDDLLAKGEIERAESYMEAQRLVFWENGYQIRRLNQAYFAFYGAYADVPGGPAGEDPVGAAVRELWARIGSPIQFLRKIAWMNEYQDLLDALEMLKVNPATNCAMHVGYLYPDSRSQPHISCATILKPRTTIIQDDQYWESWTA
ncbi:MAG TPA: hypothetical protein G4O14_13450 [Anaerolineae bacterium]|nr:hypothetical protein [Anaerolineae bacterium]